MSQADLKPEVPDAQLAETVVPRLLGILKTNFLVFSNCWSHPTTEGQELIPSASSVC